MNREMLKEAIAEAKTIKETAIANAKAALEEAFTPQLTAMFANKLNEMDDEEMMEEKSMDEMYGDDNFEEDFNLEEILAELEATEEGYSMEEEDMLNEGDEDLMLEEMSDEEIEELVVKVIDDMISSGKLMAGEEAEEEGDEEMMDDEDLNIEMEDEEDEDINIEELLSEMEDKEDLDEIVDPSTGEFIAKAAEFLGTNRDAIAAMVAALPAGVAATAFLRQLLKGRKPSKSNKTEAQLDELKNELNEVNLLNAKLLYTNKVFRSKNLTESEKIKVLNNFDKAENVKEVKLVYETIIESLKSSTKKSPIRESFSSASKTISGPSTKQPVIEVNEAFARMQKIAGLK
jgi:hypothetical protein